MLQLMQFELKLLSKEISTLSIHFHYYSTKYVQQQHPPNKVKLKLIIIENLKNK